MLIRERIIFLQFLYGFLFIIIFVPLCIYFQLSVGRFQKRRTGKSDKELKIDRKHLILGAIYYTFLAILLVISKLYF